MSQERLAKMIEAVGVPGHEAVQIAGRLKIGGPFPPGPRLADELFAMELEAVLPIPRWRPGSRRDPEQM